MNEDQKVKSPEGFESEGAPHERTQAEQALFNELDQEVSSSHDSAALQEESSSSTEIEATVRGSNEWTGTLTECFDWEEPTAGGTGIRKKASREFVAYCESEMGEAVSKEGIDYKEAYESVDKEKAAGSVDVEKAREALTY